jgi:hypothetical protein
MIIVAGVEEDTRRLPWARPPRVGPDAEGGVFVHSERGEQFLDGGR